MTCTKATAARTSRAATRSTTSSGTSRPTATRRPTRRRRARSCSRRATSTRREMIKETLQHLDRRRHHGRAVRRARLPDSRRTARAATSSPRARRSRSSASRTRTTTSSSPRSSRKAGDLSTIVVKRTPFTPAEADRFIDRRRRKLPDAASVRRARPRRFGDQRREPARGRARNAEVAAIVADSYPKNITAVTDDAPFFWHFSRFGDVIAHIVAAARRQRSRRRRSASACCCCCSGSRSLYAAVFLLAAVLRRAQEVARAAGQGHRRPCTSPRSGSASCSSRSR